MNNRTSLQFNLCVSLEGTPVLSIYEQTNDYANDGIDFIIENQNLMLTMNNFDLDDKEEGKKQTTN